MGGVKLKKFGGKRVVVGVRRTIERKMRGHGRSTTRVPLEEHKKKIIHLEEIDRKNYRGDF